MITEEILEERFEEVLAGIKDEWILNGSDDMYNYIVSLPKNLKSIYLAVIFHSQVFNGGLHQYFANGYGQFAFETIKMLNEIGATAKSKLLVEAVACVNKRGYSEEVFRRLISKRALDELYNDDDLRYSVNKLNDEFDNHENEDIS